MRKSNCFIGCVTLLALFASAANAADLGSAKDYEVMTFGDFTEANVDTNGKLAIGGNANLSSFAVSASGTSLVVGGSLNYNGGTNNGSTIVGGSATANNMSFGGGLAVNGSLSLGNGNINGPITYGGSFSAPNYFSATQATTALPVNFNSAFSTLNSMSQGLANATANGVVESFNSQHPSTLVLTGSSTGQNVFTIDGSLLSNANMKTLSINVPAGSTVVINVTGKSVEAANFGTTFNGTDAQHVLYNFSQATSLKLDGSFGGSILADNAAVSTIYGQLDGQLIAGSLSGNIETHFEYQFNGNLSYNDPTQNTPNTPEVSPFLTAGFGLMGMGIFKRRLSKRA